MRNLSLGYWLILALVLCTSCADKNKLFTKYGNGGSESSLDFYSENGYKYINLPVVFEKGSTELDSKILPSLDRLAEYMNNNGSIMLDISPTTSKYLETSDKESIGFKMALMVRDYLLESGVDLYRLTASKRDTIMASTTLNDRLQFKVLPYEHRLRPDDKVSVSIWNHPDLSVGSIFGIYNANEVTRKWVLLDSDGSVTLPELGKVKLMGMTVKEAAELLADRYSLHIVDPKIVVQILNREVTILGEVNIPGALKLEKERNSLVEVLGRAGGLKYHADRTQIQIIRGNGAEQKEIIVDLTDINTLRNQDLIVQSGDIIHIPPLDGKKIERRATAVLPFASIMSSIVLAISVLGTLNAN